MAQRDPSGDLGLILGATVGALLDQGHSVTDIQNWVESAARTRKAAHIAAAALAGADDAPA